VAVIEGDVECRRHEDGRVEILSAPPTTRISLELLTAADPAVFKVTGRTIAIAGQVVYRVTGWDNLSSCLLAELVEDKRGG
jgi:hypothetical protein